jgi:hypothetical protein
MASKTTPAPVDEWAVLFEAAEQDEVRSTAPVEVPDSVVGFLGTLRTPGPNGGKRRAKLPLNGKSYNEVVRVLRAGALLVDPPSSASCKPVFAVEDEVQVEKDGKVSFEIRDGAEPIAVTVSVGDRRGAKNKAASHAEPGEA